MAVLAVGLLSAVPSVAPVGHGAGSPAFAATVGSGSCEQTVSSATYVSVAASGADCIITFSGTTTDSNMTVDWTVPTGINAIDLLLVGGGGSGGHDEGGGGGAGLFIERSGLDITSHISVGDISIQVGAGGTYSSRSDDGGDSSFGTLIAPGGGAGGDADNSEADGTTYDGSAGGSGGGGAGEASQYQGDGGAALNSSGVSPNSGQGEYGFAGGNGTLSPSKGAGGGGAGGPGLDGGASGGPDGGPGKTSSITGSVVTYAAGGGGGLGNSAGSDPGDGGSGIGGSGGDGDTNPGAGQDGTGSGGGGGGDGSRSSTYDGGAGGDGIVIVRYTLPASPTVSSSPSDQSVNANQTATFSASASTSDGGTLSYQWQRSTDSGSSWSNVSGATASTYTTGALDATDSGDQFRVRVRNTLGSNFSDTPSSAATVTVSRIAQTVTWSPPSSQTAVDLGDSGFTITAATTDGDGSISYSPTTETGDTSCKINSSSRVVTFASTGTCTLTATAAQSDIYNSATQSVVITVSVGTFAISSPSSKVGTSASDFTDVCTSSCDVSGFAAADPILVVVNKSDGTALSGRVRLDSAEDVVVNTSYSASLTGEDGYDEIAFTGTQTQVNAALETLQYKSPTGGGDESLGISASLSGAAYFAGNGHYYKFVSASLKWSEAKAAAASSSFNGLTGYLATITSAEENAFIVEKTGGTSAWVGGSDDYEHINLATGTSTFANITESEGHWYWVTGPEAGTEFWDEHGAPSSDGRISGQFQYWNNAINQDGWGAEPNNSGSAEHYTQLLVGGTGNWNDLPNGSLLSYVIEYGDGVETSLKEASTTFDVGAPTAPLQVNGASATAGNNQVVVSWSAPDSGGSAITDYVIEQLDPDGSTWNTLTDGVSTSTSFTVTGLTNGTSYSFRVSAKNTIGTGTVSSTVSATPAAPPPSGSGGSGGTSGTPTPVVAPTTPAVPRIITPTQPTPRPSVLAGPVSSPGRGFDPDTGTRATVGGAPATVVKRALPGGVAVQTGAFQFGMELSDPNAGGGVDTQTPSNSPEVRVPTGQSTQFTGGGLLPGSQLQVWLPGRTGDQAKEIARVPVNEDGTFAAEVSFTANQNETPVAIGRQVMQVAGFDENGNQTVVDMTINVSQGPAAPEANREDGTLPDLAVGSSLATSAGIPTQVTVVPLAEEKRVSIGDGSWTLLVDVDPETGVVGGTPEAPVIQVTQDSVGSASGEGFMPGTTASVWMFSDPTLLGTVTVGEDGSFTAEFQVDSTYLPVGTHTLQVQGIGDDGYIKAANLGVDVQAPADLTATGATGLLWWVIGATLALLVTLLLIFALRRRSSRSAN